MRRVLSVFMIITLILAASTVVRAWMGTHIAGTGSGVACDDCSGTTTFTWHMENETITVGSSCGCIDAGADSVGALTGATLSGTQKSDGAYSLFCNGASDYAAFDSNPEEFSASNGTVQMDVYITDYVVNTKIWQEYNNSSEFLDIYMVSYTGDGTLDFTFRYRTDAVSNLAANNSNKSLNQWLRIKVDWKIQAGNDMKISVCDLTPPDTTANCVDLAVDRDMAAVNEPTARYIGNNSAEAGVFYIDNFILTEGDAGL